MFENLVLICFILCLVINLSLIELFFYLGRLQAIKAKKKNPKKKKTRNDMIYAHALLISANICYLII